MKTTGKRVIREVPWGMMVWQKEDGDFVMDDEGNFMNVFCTDTDPYVIIKVKQALQDAARHFGIEGGKAVFWSGKRPIDDEEYELQRAREAAGLIADPFDIAAIKEEAEALRINNGR
jgi:hypothetical protein